ncbi:hypothetical protein BH23BAC1_BH23BAC1_49230 [soil metagenome]
MSLNPYTADTCVPLKKAWSEGSLELCALTRLDYPGIPIPEDMLNGMLVERLQKDVPYHISLISPSKTNPATVGKLDINSPFPLPLRIRP